MRTKLGSFQAFLSEIRLRIMLNEFIKFAVLGSLGQKVFGFEWGQKFWITCTYCSASEKVKSFLLECSIFGCLSGGTHFLIFKFFCSHEDKQFMKKHVLHYLEKELSYTVCIHQRDFLAGESIPANMEAAIKHSRRMIMIVSRLPMIQM